MYLLISSKKGEEEAPEEDEKTRKSLQAESRQNEEYFRDKA